MVDPTFPLRASLPFTAACVVWLQDADHSTYGSGASAKMARKHWRDNHNTTYRDAYNVGSRRI